MTLGEILQQLHVPNGAPPLPKTRRNELWRELGSHVEVMVRAVLPNVPQADRDEVLSRVYYKLLKSNPLSAILRRSPQLADEVEGLDRVCRGYLASMVKNAWRDLKEQQKRIREQLGEEGTEIELFPAPTPEEAPDEQQQRESDAEQAVASIRELLEEVFQYAKSLRAARYQEALEKSWQQSKARCFERKKLHELLAREGWGPDTSEEEQIRARDRFYQSQKRLREALLRAIEEMEAQKKLTLAQAFLAREACCRWLVRCQRKKAGRVSSGGED